MFVFVIFFLRYILMLELYEIDIKLIWDRMYYIFIIVRVSFLRYLILIFYKKLFNMFILEKKIEICLLLFYKYKVFYLIKWFLYIEKNEVLC